MSSEWTDIFNEIRQDYYDTMEEIHEEMNEILNTPDSECSETDSPECIEAAIAESHNKTFASVVNGVMDVVGKCIESIVADCDNDNNYTGRSDFSKGDHLCVNSCYHAIYAGCGKVVFYSKGYDLFPEVKLVPLSTFAKKGSISLVSSCNAEIVRRAMSRLGKSNYKNSEAFIRWCKGE